MKKQEKLDILQEAISETKICRCMFTYANSFDCYPNAVNETFLLGQEDDEFLLDGYCIRKISQLKKVKFMDSRFQKLCEFVGLHKQVKMPPVDLSSWKSIFDSLKALNCFVIIENEIDEQFAIGVIEKTFKNKLYFRDFDANGIWEDPGLEIPYSKITTVKWANRYTDTWQKYFCPDTPASP